MSDFSESQLRGWNNDLMDPNWRLDPPRYESEPIEKIKALITACAPFVEAVRSVPDESAPVDGCITIRWYQVTVTVTSSSCNALVKAYDAVKFKERGQP